METLSRWETPDGRKTAAEVVKRLRKRKPLDPLGLGTVAGRVDLRGFPWPTVDVKTQRLGAYTAAVAKGDLPEIRGARLNGLDFSGAVLPHLRLFDTSVSDCLFEGALMGDLRAWNTDFEDCDLTRADLRGSVIGSWLKGKGNVWRRCRFQSTALEKIVARGALFEDCEFADAGITSLVWDACSFRRVRFTGPLSDVAFYGTIRPDGPQDAVLEDVDLTGARLRSVLFVGWRLAGVRFPYEGDFAVLPDARTRLRRALDGLRDDRSDAAYSLRVLIESTIKQYREDSDLFVNYDDLARDFGPASADLMRALVA